ncbi:hypothetical protein FQA39_LY15809 [Lamprigera yunnana]|nr:hypothetical protein FQA39_LY15809 [Lamprigera yunnana]
MYHTWGRLRMLLFQGGAGEIKNNNLVPRLIEGVKGAAKEGYKVLMAENGSVIDAVEAAVKLMEKNDIFNAGLGSVLTVEGKVEMDASIMVGSNLAAGAVTVVKNIEHPISLARLVMEQTTHVLLAGEGAENFARNQGIPILSEGSLVSNSRRKSWEKETKDKLDAENKPLKDITENMPSLQLDVLESNGETVGAIAIDSFGHVAAATSTGGRCDKLPGRSSDTCMIGCGTYADDNIGAVSTTGHGETITKFCLAHAILKEMEKGKNAQDATKDCILAMTKRLKNTGGAITISNQGDIGVSFSTNRMSWAYIKDDRIHYGIDQGESKSEPLIL